MMKGQALVTGRSPGSNERGFYCCGNSQELRQSPRKSTPGASGFGLRV